MISKFIKTAAAVAAVTMLPVSASAANSAAPLSVAGATRAGADAGGSSSQFEDDATNLIVYIALGVVVLYLLLDVLDDDDTVSA